MVGIEFTWYGVSEQLLLHKHYCYVLCWRINTIYLKRNSFYQRGYFFIHLTCVNYGICAHIGMLMHALILYSRAYALARRRSTRTHTRRFECNNILLECSLGGPSSKTLIAVCVCVCVCVYLSADISLNCAKNDSTDYPEILWVCWVWRCHECIKFWLRTN